MRVLAYSFFLAVGLCIAAPIIFCLLALQNSPTVGANRTIAPVDYNRAEKLLRRTQYALEEPRLSTTISANQQDLESLITFLARSIDGMTGAVRVLPDGIRVLASYEVPPNPIGRYVNLGLTVRPSTTGLDVAAVDIGRIHLGPPISRWLAHLAARLALGHRLGGDVISSIRGLAIHGQWATLTVRPNPTIEDRFKQRVTAVAAFAKPALIGVYYRRIMAIDAKNNHVATVPFVSFLQPILALAQQRSATSDPVTEIRAAVFALAAYFGGKRLDRLRETLLPPDLAKLPVPDSDYVTVRGRHDHVQHFIVSAAFTLSGGIGFTTTIGEAKEFDDLRHGGDDFSFQDIAADRTGITFARIAETEKGARFLESLGNRPQSEALFFPVVHDLPDSMTPAQFDATYHDIESAAFKAMLANIDSRIHACAAYASVN